MVADRRAIARRRCVYEGRLDMRPVLDLDVQMPTERCAKMPDLTGSRADLRRDVNRPPPSGLEFHPTDGRLVEVDDRHSAATQVADLLRGAKALSLQARHAPYCAVVASTISNR